MSPSPRLALGGCQRAQGAAAQPARAAALEQKLFTHFKATGHDLTSKRWDTGLNPVYPSQAKEPAKK